MEQETGKLTVAVGEDFSLDARCVADYALDGETPAIDLGPDVLDDDPSPELRFGDRTTL
jgi:hypothetical protein